MTERVTDKSQDLPSLVGRREDDKIKLMSVAWVKADEASHLVLTNPRMTESYDMFYFIACVASVAKLININRL